LGRTADFTPDFTTSGCLFAYARRVGGFTMFIIYPLLRIPRVSSITFWLFNIAVENGP
jgi:hypothetical protein